jgi:hypothetical protein
MARHQCRAARAGTPDARKPRRLIRLRRGFHCFSSRIPDPIPTNGRIRGCITVVRSAGGRDPSSSGGRVVLSEFIVEEAPFASAHASTIAASVEGVVAAWFGGPHEGHPQVRIWLSHKADARWSAPVEVARGTDRHGRPQPCWNPVLHQAAGGALAVLQGRAEPTALVGYVAHLDRWRAHLG